MITIEMAGPADVPHIAPLFDAYRMFYKQATDLAAATKFLKDRLGKDESIVFLAKDDGMPVGFTQLYPTFSSVALQPFYILNDLYVDQDHRKIKIGEALLERAKHHCKERGYKGLALETAMDNPAQKLYERLGWKKDMHGFYYFWRP